MNIKLSRKVKLSRVMFFVVLASFVASIAYVVVILSIMPSESNAISYSGRHRSDYVLMILQCALGILSLFLPSMLNKRFKVKVPSSMMVAYALFLYCAIFLGEVGSFYYNIPFWDMILHCFSGGMLGCLGFSIVKILNNEKKIPVNISPVFVSFFAFCFAVTMGVFWEIYEFTGDGLLSLNMQKFMSEGGVIFQGRDALKDTMKDLIVDCCGAGTVCVFGYFSIKLHKNWLEKFMLSKHQ